MQTAGHKTKQTVTRAAHEKTNGDRFAGLPLQRIGYILSQLRSVAKRPEVEASLLIHEMNSGGRRVGAFTILLRRIVWREKSSAGYDPVKHTQGEDPSQQSPLLRHRAAVLVRILGSAQYSSMSARKFPPMRKRVDRSTPPTTTYMSRARIASSKNGPSPGQLMTTSTSKDPLRSVPTLKPKSEMSGFAAARTCLTSSGRAERTSAATGRVMCRATSRNLFSGVRLSNPTEKARP